MSIDATEYGKRRGFRRQQTDTLASVNHANGKASVGGLETLGSTAVAFVSETIATNLFLTWTAVADGYSWQYWQLEFCSAEDKEIWIEISCNLLFALP